MIFRFSAKTIRLLKVILACAVIALVGLQTIWRSRMLYERANLLAHGLIFCRIVDARQVNPQVLRDFTLNYLSSDFVFYRGRCIGCFAGSLLPIYMTAGDRGLPECKKEFFLGVTLIWLQLLLGILIFTLSVFLLARGVVLRPRR